MENPISSWTRTLALLAVWGMAQAAVGAEAGPKEGDGSKEGGKVAAEARPAQGAPSTAEREQRILALFSATRKQFKDGRIHLEYDFERHGAGREELVIDWLPSLEETRQRVRWSRESEGTYTRYERGILVGDFGQWLHKAVFLPDVEVRVELMRVSQVRPGTLLAPVFHSAKKKLSLGVNHGQQAVCLKGWKPARPPHPRTEKQPPQNSMRHSVGYRYDGKVLESYLNKRKTGDTSEVPRFTEGFETGQVGLAWSGPIQSFIFNVTIEGRLDPDWVAQALGEKPEVRPAAARASSRSPSAKAPSKALNGVSRS